jgi:hypothetical protein
MDVLLSYAYHAKTDLGFVRHKIGDSLLVVDSGAYTAHFSASKKQISLHEYADFLKRWEPFYSAAITLDVIHNPAATARNTKRLQRMGCRVLPVFQTGTPLAEFDAMVTDNGYVAVGGIAGMGNTRKGLRADYVTMLATRARNLGGHVHLLGVNGGAVLRSGVYSADTSAPSKVMLRGLAAIYDGQRMKYLSVSDHDTWLEHHDLLTGYEIPGVADKKWWSDRAYTKAVLTAGLWSFWVESQQLQRRNIPAPDGAPAPGTRIVAAVLNKQVLALVFAMTKRIAEGDLPRSVARLVGKVAA